LNVRPRSALTLFLIRQRFILFLENEDCRSRLGEARLVGVSPSTRESAP
jgi:hypothetical protein